MKPTVGFLSVRSDMFDAQMPPDFPRRLERAAAGYRNVLEDAFDVVDPGLVTGDEDGRRAAAAFRARGVDAVVFAPTMAAPPSYAAHALDGLNVPVIVWNAPLARTLGSDLDQAEAHEHTTVVSAIMLANVLFRRGVRPHVVTATPDDAARVVAAVRAAVADRPLAGARLLRIGAPIAGYLDVECTEDDLVALGASEHEVGAGELEHEMGAVGDEQVTELREAIAASGWTGTADAHSLRVAAALLALVERHGAAGGTVNCHGPAFRSNPDVGICACLAVTLATGRGTPFSCTGDMPTAIALILSRAVAGAALYCEFYAPELSTDLALVANGGEGDPACAAGPVEVLATQHYPGVRGRGACVSFALRPGPCTLVSASPGPAGWRAALLPAEVTERRHPRMGAPNALVRPATGRPVGEALDRWAQAGATHHHALVLGRHDDALADALGRSGIEAVLVT